VSLSARLAIESPRISVDVVNIAVLPYLAIRHGVDDIPTTVANGKKACVGVPPRRPSSARFSARGRALPECRSLASRSYQFSRSSEHERAVLCRCRHGAVEDARL
jgi:hypothetical protein